MKHQPKGHEMTPDTITLLVTGLLCSILLAYHIGWIRGHANATRTLKDKLGKKFPGIF